jgi:hypothetical protein
MAIATSLWMNRTRIPIETRFWTKIAYSEDIRDCWLWTGKKRDGYGRLFGEDGQFSRYLGAHRVSWTLHFGPIPDDKIVLHKCNIRACVNPDHLYLGTHKENAQDRINCGHQYRPLSDQSRSTVLTWPQVDEIRLRQTNLKVLAARFGVDYSTVKLVANGTTWKVR